MKVKVCSPDGDTDYFDIVAGVLQLAPYLFIIYPDYMLRTSMDIMKDNVGGARGVMVIIARIGHRDTSSNPGLIAFHITLIPLGKV